MQKGIFPSFDSSFVLVSLEFGSPGGGPGGTASAKWNR
jgi:hypothetical protein